MRGGHRTDLAARREFSRSRSRQPLELTSPRLRALTGVWIRRWFYRILLYGDELTASPP